MNYTPDLIKEVREVVWEYYHAHGRDMPWRDPEADGSFDAYKIMVSEIMLQQTQVSRVIPKFNDFIARFPDPQALARASLADVLSMWSGLGYNRRAKFLHLAAQKIVKDFDGDMPKTIDELVQLPGIGTHTAGAIVTYAYNQSVVFLETNIRTILIYHFFEDVIEPVHDKQLIPILDVLLDHDHPREFGWALMDYGAYLKRAVGNLSRSAKVYQKQSKFEGSLRQIRGQVLRELLTASKSYNQLFKQIPDERLTQVLVQLTHESLVILDREQYKIA